MLYVYFYSSEIRIKKIAEVRSGKYDPNLMSQAYLAEHNMLLKNIK